MCTLVNLHASVHFCKFLIHFYVGSGSLIPQFRAMYYICKKKKNPYFLLNRAFHSSKYQWTPCGTKDSVLQNIWGAGSVLFIVLSVHLCWNIVSAQ